MTAARRAPRPRGGLCHLALASWAAVEAVFTAEDASKLRLGDLVGIAQALHGVDAEPGLAYRVVTVSVNEAEGPADALAKKSLALASVEKPFPATAWRFLVGSDPEIDRLADSVGFSYAKRGEDFDHPLGIIVLSPEGKIVRYLPGSVMLPVDVSMSLLEASSGLVGPTVATLLRLYLSYNPQSRQFGSDLLRVSGIVITILVGSLAACLALSGWARRRRPQGR